MKYLNIENYFLTIKYMDNFSSKENIEMLWQVLESQGFNNNNSGMTFNMIKAQVQNKNINIMDKNKLFITLFVDEMEQKQQSSFEHRLKLREFNFNQIKSNNKSETQLSNLIENEIENICNKNELENNSQNNDNILDLLIETNNKINDIENIIHEIKNNIDIYIKKLT